MDIKIHRGLNQIGGCITEISTATSRVFIDMGQNLPGVGVPNTPEQGHLCPKPKGTRGSVLFPHP